MHAPSMLIVACIVVASASSLTPPQANNNPVAFQCTVATGAAAHHPKYTSNQLMDDQDHREPRRETIKWTGIFTQSHAIPPRSKTFDFWKMNKARKIFFDHQSESLLVSVKNNHPIITTADGNRSMVSAAFSSNIILLRQPNNSLDAMVAAMVAAMLTTVPWIALSVGLLMSMYLNIIYINKSLRGKLNSATLDHHRRVLNSACANTTNLSSPLFWRALVLLMLPWLTNAAGCSNTNATQINVASCTCGTTDCTAATGLYCEIKRNKCFSPEKGVLKNMTLRYKHNQLVVGADVGGKFATLEDNVNVSMQWKAGSAWSLDTSVIDNWSVHNDASSESMTLKSSPVSSWSTEGARLKQTANIFKKNALQ